LEEGDEEGAISILTELISFGERIEKSKKKGFFERLFGGKPEVKVATEEETKKWIVKSPKESKEIEARIEQIERLHEMEMEKLQKQLAEARLEIEGLKGAYTRMAEELSKHKREIDKENIKDVTQLKMKVKELKSSLDKMHEMVEKELGFSKSAYKEFGSELLYLATKVAEIEDAIDREDVITDADIASLKQHIVELEGKLRRIEANEKLARIELLKQLRKDQKRMLKELENKQKARTKKFLDGLSKRVEELTNEVEDRQNRISAEVHKELKQSYEKLVDQLWKLQDEIQKMKERKSVKSSDIEKISKSILKLSKTLDKLEEQELPSIEEEVKKQEVEDMSLAKKIELLGKRIDILEQRVEQKLGDEDLKAILERIEDVRASLRALHPNVKKKVEKKRKAKKKGQKKKDKTKKKTTKKGKKSTKKKGRKRR